jgi:alpha-glucosidase
LTLRGTPTCYYGDEIGMEDVPIPLARVMDPPAVNQPEIAHIVGRDPERTPMQWDSSPNAGFSPEGIQTWLPVSEDYDIRNVAVQTKDPRSMLNYFRALTDLRQSEPALTIGAYLSIDTGSPNVFGYLRSYEDTQLLIVLNFIGKAERLDLSMLSAQAKLLLSTEMGDPQVMDLGFLDIKPNEGLILQLL